MPKGGSSTVTQTIDPKTQAYVEQLRKAAMAAGPGYAPYQAAGQQGIAALSGDPAAQQQFLNPYEANLNPLWDQARQNALNAVSSQATGAGAYGGSRQGVAQGVALGQIANAQGAQQYQAFGDAQQRAALAAQMGFGAIGAPVGLMGSSIGPYGQTQKTTMETDPWSQILGAGLTIGGFALGGPAGGYAGYQAGQALNGGGQQQPTWTQFGQSGLGNPNPYSGQGQNWWEYRP